MNFVNGQEYSGNGVTATYNSQTGCFHSVVDGVSKKYTAAQLGLESVEVATPVASEE